jgi:hypothetical protein
VIIIGGGGGSNFWSILGPASTILAALIGWIIVERYARGREVRGDLRLLSQSVVEAIDRIALESFEFYSLDAKDPKASALALSIKSKIQTLSSHLTTLRAGGMRIETDPELLALRKEITGGAFESALRPPFQPDSAKMLQIRSVCENLKSRVESEFYRDLIGRSVRKGLP